MTPAPANPLLIGGGLPPFETIAPEHVAPAMRELLAATRARVEALATDAAPATWDNFAEPLASAIEKLSWSWGVVGHLHSVKDIPPWRDAYNEMLPEMSRFYAELGQDLRLFARYRALRESPQYATLGRERQRVIDNEVRDFRLSGAELPEERKPRFQTIQEELAQLAAKFAENLLDATNAFAEWVESPAEIAGIPADVLATARAAAEKENRAGWKFTLHMPSYLPVMQYADSRRLRETMYRGYATRAAEFNDGSSKPEWDNNPLIARLLALRHEEAQMLGYASFAELSLVPKMADSPAEVMAFLRELAAKARPFAERDLAELRDFARSALGLDELMPWDMAYASEKLKQQRYSFSDDEVKQYFPEPRVMAGLFSTIERLFDVAIREDRAPVWHEDVKFYRIETRGGDTGGRLVGQFYVDLYARETKRGGAWMDEAVTRRLTAAGVQTPVAYLNCNFSRPVNGKPALMTHDEVQTLFHETGHGLHHLLTRCGELGVSGIRGVEWDAVELPSQFLENFCWEWDVVAGMSAHVDSGETLPRVLFERMLAAKNFQSGMQTLRQIEFALFDMRLHAEYDPAAPVDVMALLESVRDEVAVVRPPRWNRFPQSFSHIFGGGYAAGYYSYKWAEVLSADAYAAFEEEARDAASLLEVAAGKRFLDEILSVGGSRPAMESFKAFRGREPSVDALLRHSGMIAA
jgi:oligopeptidase A